MTALEWAKKFEDYQLTVRNRAMMTVKSYAIPIRELHAAFVAGRGDDWNLVTRDAAIEYLRGLKRRCKDVTAASKIYGLKTFFRYLKREGVVTDNPFDDMEFCRLTRALPRFLSVDEMNRLLNAIRTPAQVFEGIPSMDVYLTMRDRAMLEVLYSCGLRVSELVALNWSDINEGRREIIVLVAKGGKQRVVPLGEKAAVALHNFKAHYEEQWKNPPTGMHPIFISHCGRRIVTRSIPRTINKWLAVAGVKTKISAHGFRHSCGTHLLEGGMDLRLVQQLLGHANISTTQIYTHVSTKQLRAAHANAHPRA